MMHRVVNDEKSRKAMVSLTKRKTKMKKKIKNISRAIPLAVALGVILMAAAIAVTSAQAQPPPIKLECTFHRMDFTKQMIDLGFSKTKVPPTDMAWLLPGADPMHINFTYAEAGQHAYSNRPVPTLGGVCRVPCSARVAGSSRPAQIGANFAFSWQRWRLIMERTPSTIKYLRRAC